MADMWGPLRPSVGVDATVNGIAYEDVRAGKNTMGNAHASAARLGLDNGFPAGP